MFLATASLLAPGVALAYGTAGGGETVFAVPSLGIYYCGIEAKHSLSGVGCDSTNGHLYRQRATLVEDGHVTLCHERGKDNHCNLGSPPKKHIPTLHSGKPLELGPYRCELSRAGLKCTVRASGKGFLMTKTKLAAIGGASVTVPPLQLAAFLSPDHEVLCWISVTQTFCATGGNQPLGSRQSLATVTDEGHVTICVSPEVAVGSECIQNWDSGLPLLQLGQSTEMDSFRCSSASNGITCTVIGSGKGFRISATEAVEVVQPQKTSG
jgi:hypothetical protein